MHSCTGRNKYVEHDKMEPLAFYYFIFQLAFLSVFMHKIKTCFNLFRFQIKLLFLLEQFDKIEWIQKENLFLLKSGVRLVLHFSFDLNFFIYSINYLSRDLHFVHQCFSNFLCKMYVQFNKREAPFLRVPHTCSGWRNCAWALFFLKTPCKNT